jgi:hypothetical protein
MISIKSNKVLSSRNYPPLEEVTSPTVPTAQAAHYLNRVSQTLRIWAMGKADAPITPVRIHGRLAWPVARIRELLGVEQ